MARGLSTDQKEILEWLGQAIERPEPNEQRLRGWFTQQDIQRGLKGVRKAKVVDDGTLSYRCSTKGDRVSFYRSLERLHKRGLIHRARIFPSHSSWEAYQRGSTYESDDQYRHITLWGDKSATMAIIDN